MVFDFGKFGGDALRSIDRIRSISSKPSHLSEQPSGKVESRINSFYRAIGLPAIVSGDTNLPSNNGNVHSITMTEELKNKFLQREQSFSSSLSENTIDDFLDFNKSKLSDGIRFNSTSTTETPKRRRGSLFPLFVYGDIGIFPQSNRISGAFFNQNQVIIDNIKYERPLLEFITLLRLKGAGAQNSELQNKINSDFEKSLGSGFVDPSGLNIFTFEIIRQLLITVLSIKDVVRNTIQDLGIIRSEIRTIFGDKKGNIPDEQPTIKRVGTDGALDIFIQNQINVRNSIESVYALLEYDDTQNPLSSTRNLRDIWLASSVIDLLTAESQKISTSIEDTSEQNAKLLHSLKLQNRSMDLLLGTFSGLSGVDILVVITALFVIDQETLLGLFNEDSFQRLVTLKGQGFSATRLGVQTAINNLQNKIIELYDIIDNIVGLRSLLESNTVQNRGF